MSAIERLRFFDGERLGSADWQAEQAYHVAMRRMHNGRVHIPGIVDGLMLDVDPDSAPGATFYSISPGLALDERGREIVLEAPYVLRPEVDLTRQGLKSGTANVWLCYRESSTTPPAAGYRLCNETNQSTRWREGFEVVVAMQSGSGPMVDPGKGCVLVGTLLLDSSSGSLQINSVASINRTYVGIRAQKIVAPAGDPKTFNILGTNARKESLEVEPTTFIDKHLIVGDDFVVDKTKVVGDAPDDTLKSGDVKVTNDLFVNGNLYFEAGGKWYTLGEYIKSLSPEIVVGSVPVTPAANQATDPSFDNVLPKITLTSKLPSISSVKVITGITAITLRTKSELQTWYSTITPSSQWILEASHDSPSINGQQVEVQLKWRVGPQDHPPGANPPPSVLPVASFAIHYVVICYP